MLPCASLCFPAFASFLRRKHNNENIYLITNQESNITKKPHKMNLLICTSFFLHASSCFPAIASFCRRKHNNENIYLTTNQESMLEITLISCICFVCASCFLHASLCFFVLPCFCFIVKEEAQ